MRAMSPLKTSDSLPFLKMHGAGNDFVVIDSRNQEARVNEALAMISSQRFATARPGPTLIWISGTVMDRAPGLAEMRPAALRA
jgi:hypothetical protein